MMEAATKIEGLMPVIGLGTWEIYGRKCTESVQDAINMGYRHIDTAQLYENEEEVGKGIGLADRNRDEIFLTTKIATNNLTPERIRQSTRDSLSKLDSGYIDLLLIHWPTPGMDLEACLDAMHDLQEEGIIKHLGVSNFKPGLFEKALHTKDILNNQVHFSPDHKQFDNLKVAKEKHKVITAYSPLDRGKTARNDTLGKLGEKYGKSASQVALRWLVQLGNISVIPKAQSQEHRAENLDIFDFELDEEDMKTINEL